MSEIVNAADESISNIGDVTSNVNDLTVELKANREQAENNMNAVGNLETEVQKFII